MRRICFVTIGNLYMVPYIDMYKKYIKGEYSVIYWDRENKNEYDVENTYYRFNKSFDPHEKIRKAFGYIQYHNYVKKVLLENQFDMVILLQTWSALLLADVLTKNYSGKYIVDIRDYTYEKNPIIYNIEKVLVKNSYSCVVSSKGYMEFLPPHKYFVAHNMRELSPEKVYHIQNRKKQKDKLSISFVGYVNYQEQHKKLMLALKNDDRFHLNFVGTRAKELKSFCDENGIENVTLIDTFDSDKILDFYLTTDFVNNLYGNHTPTLDYALSNKLYFAAELQMPILVCKDTYMSTVSEQYGFGYTVDVIDDNLGNQLFEYYSNINWEKLKTGCQNFLRDATLEQEQFVDIIKKAVGYETELNI